MAWPLTAGASGAWQTSVEVACAALSFSACLSDHPASIPSACTGHLQCARAPQACEATSMSSGNVQGRGLVHRHRDTSEGSKVEQVEQRERWEGSNHFLVGLQGPPELLWKDKEEFVLHHRRLWTREVHRLSRRRGLVWLRGSGDK